MNFLLNENLDDHYEEWNRSIYLENNLQNDIPVSSNYDFIDELPNMEFDFKQEQMSLQMSLSNESLGSSLDPLDDIDPDSLFYQKSFTELTPVKCEYNGSDSLLAPESLTVPELPCSNTDKDVYVQNFNKNSGLTSNLVDDIIPNVTQNNIYEQADLTKFIFLTSHQNLDIQDLDRQNLDHQDLDRQNLEFTMQESCSEFDINIQDEFEFQLFNSNQNQLTSEYIKYEPPIYEGENEEPFETESNHSSTDSCASTHDSFHQESSSQECGESSWVKEIKIGKNTRPRGPKCWEFLLRLLRDNASNPSLLKWENSELGSFKLVEKDKISAIWGNRPSKKKNGKIIKYESFARILRYHYKKGNGMILPVSEKHLVYKFASEVMAAFRAGKIL